MAVLSVMYLQRPTIRTRQSQLKEKGVSDPQMDWGQYLFIRQEIPEQLEHILSRKKSWRETLEGKGVVLLCSGTDLLSKQADCKCYP